MNGHSNDIDYAPMPDDDGGPEQTDIECPFCGHYIEWQPPALYCDNCEVYWTDAAQVERDRREQHDELSDTDSFDRSLISIGGMLR